MLSFRRQASYWALSLSAVGILNIIQNQPESRTIYYSCVFVTIIVIAQDWLVRSSTDMDRAKRINLCAKLAYYSMLGTAIITLGYSAPLLANGPIETKYQRELLIHVRLALILLAEAEWWRNKTEDAYFEKLVFPFVIPGIKISSRSRLGTIITTIAIGLLIEILYRCFIHILEIPILGREASGFAVFPPTLSFLDDYVMYMNWILDCPLRMAATSTAFELCKRNFGYVIPHVTWTKS